MKHSAPAALERRKAPRQARSAVTVDAIFEGVIQVLASVGPSRLTTTRVAGRAGVSVGTLYQYFPNKQSLLVAVLERHLTGLMDGLEAACAQLHGGRAEDMTAATVRYYLSVKAENPEAARALYLVAMELDSRGLVEAAIVRAENAIAAMLASAADGRFPAPLPVARSLFAAIHGTFRMFYERELAPAIAGEAERQLALMCRAYVAAAIEPA